MIKEKLRILPRWIIFLLDVFIVIGSVFIAKILRHNLSIEIVLDNAGLVILLVLATNIPLFIIFRTYAGIVRYTNFRDAVRILVVSLIASIVYTFVGIYCYGKGILILSRSTILINLFVVTSSLIGYRVFVRSLFRAFFTSQAHKYSTRAAIYDTSEQGMTTKKIISDYPRSHIHVVAFIDDSHNKRGKLMEGLPIFGIDDYGFQRLKQEKVELLIIANKRITRGRLNRLVDTALKYNIRVQQVPDVQQWVDGKIETGQLKDVNIEELLERDVISIENEKVYQSIRGKKILVTGAAGSIGSELVRQLVRCNPSLLLLCDIAETPMHELMLELKETAPEAPVRNYIGDIGDRQRMEHLFEVFAPDIVFHAAAYKHVPLMEENPSVAVLNNVSGTKILAELSVANQVEKFVMISTDKAVNPTNVMGASKRIAEIFTQSYFKSLQRQYEKVNSGIYTRFITTRFGNVLGSNGSVIPRFRQQLQKGGPLTITHPDITRYFMTIPEACQLVIEAGTMGQGGEIFVFDMGNPVKIVDLAYKMIRLSGKEPDKDIKVIFTGLRPGEKLFEEVLSNAENTIPTYHEKIMIAKVREYDFNVITEKIDRLLERASHHYTYETVAIMKELVPEYISKNSAFEKLDAKNPDNASPTSSAG